MIYSILIVSAAGFFSLFGVNWEAIDARIAEEYPAVQTIEGDVLLKQLQTAEQPAPQLVDVREQDEFAVSHLQGARNWQSATEIAQQLTDKTAPIVVYCSVGYRSAGVASELAAMGYTQVRNLRHSIFAWANTGKPMVNAQGATDKAHPFNLVWGSLLIEPLRQRTP